MSTPDISFSNIGKLAEPPVISEIMTLALEDKELLSLAAGFTDTEALPVRSIRDVAVSLASNGKSPEYLQYGSTMGRSELRKLVSKRIRNFDNLQSTAYHPDHVMLTNGSQQALYLAVQVLCNPGEIMLVEGPSYFVFLELLKGLGVQAVGIPVDDHDEIDTVALGGLLDEMKESGSLHLVKGLYVESWYSNPSTRCLTSELKIELANVLKQREVCIPILEDGAYLELYFDEKFASKTILGIREFEYFPRIFFGTFTKPFASGLKVGYAICDHHELLKKMANVKGHHDFGSSNYTQAIVEQVVMSGAFDAQLERGRIRYREKMEILHSVLIEEGLPEMGWSWKKPEGGMFLWLKGPRSIDSSREAPFFENAVKKGVLYVPGDLCFAPGGPKNYIRLSFGVLERDDLVLAGKRLAEVVRKFI